jgi:hypothetical protein
MAALLFFFIGVWDAVMAAAVTKAQWQKKPQQTYPSYKMKCQTKTGNVSSFFFD